MDKEITNTGIITTGIVVFFIGMALTISSCTKQRGVLKVSAYKACIEAAHNPAQCKLGNPIL